jgi:hypothetical protein
MNMELKDLSVTIEKLDAVRGGAAVAQGIANDYTLGFSVASGGGVNSATSSDSYVFSSHLNTQSASAIDERRRGFGVLVENSQNVFVGRLSGRFVR